MAASGGASIAGGMSQILTGAPGGNGSLGASTGQAGSSAGSTEAGGGGGGGGAGFVRFFGAQPPTNPDLVVSPPAS